MSSDGISCYKFNFIYLVKQISKITIVVKSRVILCPESLGLARKGRRTEGNTKG